MKYREVPAPPQYRHLADCVWFLTGRGDQYHPQPVVPDGRIELLVHRADCFQQLHSDGRAEVQNAVLVAGQLTRPIHLQPGAVIDVVGIRLNPIGARALLAIPLDELTDGVRGLREVSPRIAAALEGAAAIPGLPIERAGAILQALSRALSQAPDPAMMAAMHSLAGGMHPSISGIAAKHGMSGRTLERRFRSEVGMSPKMYQRVVRFRRAFRLLEAGRGSSARIAAAAGYFDQAHLIRDFKQFTGASPRRFFRPETPLAGLLLSDLAGDPPHGEIETAGAATLRSFDSGDQ